MKEKLLMADRSGSWEQLLPRSAHGGGAPTPRFTSRCRQVLAHVAQIAGKDAPANVAAHAVLALGLSLIHI